MKQDGPKILFSDNLASHFNPRVIEVALNILPANGTHMQPPDVAVFALMKRSWRKVWTNTKQRNAERERFKTVSFQCCLTAYGLGKHTQGFGQLVYIRSIALCQYRSYQRLIFLLKTALSS